MKYIVIELQENADGTVGNSPFAFDDALEAESKYHAILSVAAKSSVLHHSAFLIDSYGGYRNSQCYDHPTTEAK